MWVFILIEFRVIILLFPQENIFLIWTFSTVLEFLMQIDLLSYSLAKLFIIPIAFCRFRHIFLLRQSCHLQTKGTFTFFFLTWMLFISFSCLITLARGFHLVLNRSSESEQPFCSSSLSRKNLFLTITYDVSCRTLADAFYTKWVFKLKLLILVY